ncbi:uncharacterized protein KY384_007792 [Bacidia gigantensis]|uniref:uncharacterized protein n=1 Tax=Bacidia gigantensis TaxID=2732470 RepID=UPI001D037183|nr:uncharacterized protein KY384_007792 [Bacidia gigantensis]KAG8527639.1 hypothetical protein KY384_007792 [Bacidia gigantensis]
MSASYSQPKFDDRISSHYNNHHAPKTSHHASSIKRAPPAAAVYANKAIAKDGRSELSTPSSTDTSVASNPPGSARTKSSSDWGGDVPSTTHDASEAQLVPGPPGIARRAKAHVPSACVNCKKKHLACETKRPCTRCVHNGKENLMKLTFEPLNRKRGRPRLREDDSFREMTLGTGSSYGDVYQTQAGVLAAAQPGRHRSKTYRELRSQPETAYVDQRPRTSDPAFNQTQYPRDLLSYGSSIPATSYQSSQIPTVLLSPDFVVAQHNRAFTDALSLQITARGQTLVNLVIPAEREKIRRLQAAMRAEYHNSVHAARKHGDLNTIDTMPSIDQLDIMRATAGFETRSEYWTFRLPREQSRGYPISISLARDGGFFVILTLIQSANPLQSPQLLQQPMLLSATSLGGMPSPPNSLYQSNPSQDRHQRNSSTDISIPYLSSPAGSGFEDALMPMHPTQSTANYQAASPPRSVQVPYSTPRTNSSSSASASGSEIPRSSPTSSHHPMPRDNLKHLQLPPIRTAPTPTSEPQTPRDQRRRHGTTTPSPARSSPHNSKRKKRRRLEIGDVLH